MANTTPEEELETVRLELAGMCGAPFVEGDHDRYGYLLARQALLLLCLRESGQAKSRQQRSPA